MTLLETKADLVQLACFKNLSDYKCCMTLLETKANFITEDLSFGIRIAQMVFNNLPEVRLEEVEELTETPRGEGGFGSTGLF